MGFFSDMWNAFSGPDDAQLAIIDSIALTIIHDGQVSPEEQNFAVGFVASMLDVEPQEADNYMSQGVERVQNRHPHEVLNDITSRLPDFDSRRLAFLSSVGASRAEGGFFTWGEEDLLDDMAQAFGFDPHQRDMITQDAENMMR